MKFIADKNMILFSNEFTFTNHIEDVPNKSQFIAVALKEKIEMIKKKELDNLLIEGYKATRNEDNKINDDWERVTFDQ